MSRARPSARIVAALDRVARHSGLLGLMRRRNGAGATILMYHKVLPASLAGQYPLPNLVVDADVFARQMQWLAANFEVLPVREAMARLDGDRTGARRPLACVTFDDGYRDNFEHAAPALEAAGLRGTFFVTTGFVAGTPLWFDRAAGAWRGDAATALGHALAVVPERESDWRDCATLDAWLGYLKRLPAERRMAIVERLTPAAPGPDAVFGAMSPSQLRRLSECGHEVAAHSATHPILTGLGEDALRAELEAPRTLLGDWTGVAPEGCCYPNGDCDERVVAAARAAGYRYACSVRRGVAWRSSDRMALPRRAVLATDRGATVEDFEAEIVGWHDAMRRAKERLRRPWRS